MRNLVLTGVAGWESTDCSATIKKVLTKFLKDLLKTLEDSHEELCNEVPFSQIAGVQNTAFSPTCF